MKLLAVGDIHGYLDKLEKLMTQVCPTQEDQVVFLGDYVDRGPNSAGVIDYLIGFARTFPKTVFLQGNHEQMMLDFLHDRRRIPGWVPMAERSERYAWKTCLLAPVSGSATVAGNVLRATPRIFHRSTSTFCSILGFFTSLTSGFLSTPMFARWIR